MRLLSVLFVLLFATGALAQAAATIQQGQSNFIAQKNTPPAPTPAKGKIAVHPKTLADYRAQPVQQQQ
jgi:hypothetical protein